MTAHSFSADMNVDQVFLCQGQTLILAARERARIFTPLGSCVSCILFHRDVGAVITHAKYPHRGVLENPSSEIVDLSTRSAIEHFAQSDIPQKCWDVMLFGGGVMHHALEQHFQYSLLGWQNIISALNVLQEKQLPISFGHFGGFGGRRLKFWSATGHVVCERLLDSYGGISVSSTTPPWLLLESMNMRMQKLQSSTLGENLAADWEEYA
jgi:chemotaxis receptor (MCP) glutamine deamidase CheD